MRRPNRRRWWLGMAALIGAVLLAAGGCSTIGYYSQAIVGHLDVMQRARPIETRLAEDAMRPELRARLLRALEIRDFASRELALPDNGSYRSYADLQRPFVVWNVVAADALSVRPRASCFPIAGCVSYRGFYKEADARRHADALVQEGLDVYVHGVAAYSTLGWFDDPLLNTFIQYSELELARLVFHELAHQVLYVRDDTTFNESFAMAVEEAGIARWLARNPQLDIAAYRVLEQRRAEFIALVMRYRDRLEALYATDAARESKLADKARAFEEMRTDYRRLRESWGGWGGYDRWFAQPLGNAHVASIATYNARLPAFRALLAREGGDLARFYEAAKALGRLPKRERDAQLDALAPAVGARP